MTLPVCSPGMRMTAAFRCPACGASPVNVAQGHDPFALRGSAAPFARAAVSMTCAAGHPWIESQDYDRDGEPVGARRLAACDPHQ